MPRRVREPVRAGDELGVHDPLARLPRVPPARDDRGAAPDGIALQVTVAREHPLVARHALRWPPRIRARDVTAGFEGVPRRYGVYQLFARFGHIEAYVWAFFGRARPTAGQLAAANAELRTVRLHR